MTLVKSSAWHEEFWHSQNWGAWPLPECMVDVFFSWIFFLGKERKHTWNNISDETHKVNAFLPRQLNLLQPRLREKNTYTPPPKKKINGCTPKSPDLVQTMIFFKKRWFFTLPPLFFGRKYHHPKSSAKKDLQVDSIDLSDPSPSTRSKVKRWEVGSKFTWVF